MPSLALTLFRAPTPTTLATFLTPHRAVTRVDIFWHPNARLPRPVLPDVEYELRVLPANRDRLGRIWEGQQFSEWTPGRTSEGVPRGPVVAVQSSNDNRTDGSLGVSWLPVEQPNGGSGRIVSYNLTWSRCTDSACTACANATQSVLVPAPANTTQSVGVHDPAAARADNPTQVRWIPGDRVYGETEPLQVNTGYRLAVLPSTAAGPGLVWSEPLCAISPPGLPSPPLNLTRSVSEADEEAASFAWEMPADPNGAVLGYLLELCNISAPGEADGSSRLLLGPAPTACDCTGGTDAASSVTAAVSTPASTATTTTTAPGTTVLPTASTSPPDLATSATLTTSSDILGTTTAAGPSTTTSATTSTTSTPATTVPTTAPCACDGTTAAPEISGGFACGPTTPGYASVPVLERSFGGDLQGKIAAATTVVAFVRARTGAGLGNQSNLVVFNTSTAPPSGAVTEIVVEPVVPGEPTAMTSGYEAEVSFAPLSPDRTGGLSVNYTVSAQLAVDGSSIPSVVTGTGRARLTDLDAFTEYILRIQASNSKGVAELSTPVAFRTASGYVLCLPSRQRLEVVTVDSLPLLPACEAPCDAASAPRSRAL